VALATAPAVAAQAPSRAPVAMTIIVEKSKTWGPVLATAGNWTVYRLVGDSKDKSTCFHACLKAWPAVLLDKGQAEPIGDAVQHLGFIVRPDGARQVTYEGIPLYFFIKDKKAWEITGNIKDKWGQWWVLNPSNPLSTPKQAGGGGGTTTTIPGGVAY
jgi:predicted lipoprotein with Yx(FWY)xxD motif